MKTDLFRKESIKKILGTEDRAVSDYVRNISFQSWIVLVTAAVLLICLLIWIFTASLPDRLRLTGFSEEGGGRILCYLPADMAGSISYNTPVLVDNQYEGRVLNISAIPLSKAEAAAAMPSDYYKNSLSLSEWNHTVLIECIHSEFQRQSLHQVLFIREEIILSDLFH